MQFSVYLNTQNISAEEPMHTAPRRLALKIVAGGDGFRVAQNAIKLREGKTWREIKHKYQPEKRPPRLLPALDHYLPYNYPLPYALLRNYWQRVRGSR